MIFKAPVMIFGFCMGEHITGIVVNSVITNTTYVISKITFLDSLQGDGTRSVDTVLAFLQWLATHKDIVLDVSNIQHDITPTAHMIRQRPYRPPGASKDKDIQIDCGIYFFLMVLLHIGELPLSLLTPITVHQFRIYLAQRIIHSSFPLNICDIIQHPALLQHANLACDEPTDNSIHICPTDDNNGAADMCVTRREHISQNHIDTSTTNDQGISCSSSRSHLRRKVQKLRTLDQHIPIPKGRTLIDVNINDAAFDHSYAASSTLSDPSNNIDAGAGLFARRDFTPDSTLEDWDLVGYYIGCKPLSMEDAMRYMYDPEPDINTGFMIVFGGLAADGWNHTLGTYTCATAIINDPLDNDKYNCGWHRERLRNLKGKPTGDYVIAVRSDPDKTVRAHQEWGISYGHTPWCNARLPLAQLFKAITHYYDEIMRDPHRLW